MTPLEFAVAPPPGPLRTTVPFVLGILLCILVVGWLVSRRRDRRRYLRWFLPALALFEVVVFSVMTVVNYRGAPTAYLLEEGSLTVLSRTGETKFELASFATVEPDSEMRWHHAYGGRGFSCQMQGRRNCGPYGCFGVTRPPGLPWVNLQLTDHERVVALEGRLNLLVSPEDQQGFIREVRKRLQAGVAAKAKEVPKEVPDE